MSLKQRQSNIGMEELKEIVKSENPEQNIFWTKKQQEGSYSFTCVRELLMQGRDISLVLVWNFCIISAMETNGAGGSLT